MQVLPRAGGLLDQDFLLVMCMGSVAKAQSKKDKLDAQRAKEEAKRGKH